jgi:predicted DCC family thiol-disulfide oxidoreductase YuxK
MTFTLFYDGSCPLCVAEMNKLRVLNHAEHLHFEDILVEGFTEHYPDICIIEASNILHGKLDSGELLLGLDATHKAWSLVGHKKWIGILRMPFIKPIADQCYLLFARNRYRFSYLLTGKAKCNSGGTCGISSPQKNKTVSNAQGNNPSTNQSASISEQDT